MNTDQGRIGRVETCDITSRPSLSIFKFRILISIGAAALEKLQERLIGFVVVDFFQDLVDLGTEVTLAEFPLLSTQLFSLQLSGTDVMLSQQGPYFGRTAVDKFGAKFDWRIADRIMLAEDAAAYAVAGFQDRDLESGPGKLHRG